MRQGTEVHFKPSEDGDILVNDSGEKLRLQNSSAEPVIFTVGEFGADGFGGLGTEYDIEINASQNTVPEGGSLPARFVLVNGVVFPQGVIQFDGAAATFNIVSLPDDIVPMQTETLCVNAYDSSEGVDKPCTLVVRSNKTVLAYLMDGEAFAIDDTINLSGSYLAAPSAE